jgi:lactoylglutathione lyase
MGIPGQLSCRAGILKLNGSRGAPLTRRQGRLRYQNLGRMLIPQWGEMRVAMSICPAIVERMSFCRKLLHTRYRVNDIERTVRFYRDVLGLIEVRRHKSPRGAELVFLKAPESEPEIEICYLPGSPEVQVQADLTHLAFEVESMEAFAKHLDTLGLKFSDGPTTTSSGSFIAFVDAPEGYEIELIQAKR